MSQNNDACQSVILVVISSSHLGPTADLVDVGRFTFTLTVKLIVGIDSVSTE